MLNNLEPIRYSRNQIVFEELDEYSEVVFLVNSAKFEVGYSINKNTFYKLQKQNIDIGAYGVTFRVRSHYIWRTT